MADMNEFLNDETARMEEDRKNALKDKNFNQLAKMAVGENHLTFSLTDVPRDGTGRLLGKKLFKVVINGQTLDYPINPKSPMYRDIIANLKAGKVKMKIIRTGTGQTDTRYSVVAE